GRGDMMEGSIRLRTVPSRGHEMIGTFTQISHHLHKPVEGQGLHNRGSVVLSDGEEEGFLVAEVVEDGAAGQPCRLLQPADGGALVPVPGEALARRREDFMATRIELILAHPGHGVIVTGSGEGRNPYVRLVMRLGALGARSPRAEPLASSATIAGPDRPVDC